VYPDAVDITNATPSEACSDGITAAISPAEIFLGRALAFSWERPELKADCEKLKPSSMGKKPAAQAAATKELLIASREKYQKKIEDADKNANNKLRIFEIGDKVLTAIALLLKSRPRAQIYFQSERGILRSSVVMAQLARSNKTTKTTCLITVSPSPLRSPSTRSSPHAVLLVPAAHCCLKRCFRPRHQLHRRPRSLHNRS
jgi:hypothetical protein